MVSVYTAQGTFHLCQTLGLIPHPLLRPPSFSASLYSNMRVHCLCSRAPTSHPTAPSRIHSDGALPPTPTPAGGHLTRGRMPMAGPPTLATAGADESCHHLGWGWGRGRGRVPAQVRGSGDPSFLICRVGFIAECSGKIVRSSWVQARGVGLARTIGSEEEEGVLNDWGTHGNRGGAWFPMATATTLSTTWGT